MWTVIGLIYLAGLAFTAFSFYSNPAKHQTFRSVAGVVAIWPVYWTLSFIRR